jgi:ATP-dependent exoDNAse (exonuclease V) alpha subunit
VLRDLIACGRIPRTPPTVIERQGEGSPIVDAAHAINRGQLPVARSTAAGHLYILRARLISEDGDLHAQRVVVETSHRAQGSERSSVVVVLGQSHYLMLQRNLLYTALTRARKRAVLIVSGGLENKQTGRIFKTALEVAVANDKIALRYSGLAERLARWFRHCSRLRPGERFPGRRSTRWYRN